MTDHIVTLTSLDSGFCSHLVSGLTGADLYTGSARGSAVRRDEHAPEWAVPTAYGETFRGLIIDGEDTGVEVPAELLDTARRISGLPEVVAFRAQANAMLAGTGLGRHTDVPEFWGARRYTFPDWLLVTMLHSGLFDADRIRVVSALVWPMETNGGDLCVFDRYDRSLVACFPPVPATAVVLDTCRLPHEVREIPGDPVPVAMGDRIVLGAGGWTVLRHDGSTETLPAGQVRTSVLVKLACFADPGERARWSATAESPREPQAVIDTLAHHLPRAGADTGLHQRLVDHFVPYR